MCGIAGFFNWNSTAPVPSRALHQAAKKMALRGPDADGFFEKRGVGFAHRRLKVIDLAGGRQPIVDSATGVSLTYNGEIYNFKALRTELKTLGHAFQTVSDTEVLLRSYLQWGKACLDRLVGIFAFGIYDPRDESLFLARDRMGAKPLYYAHTSDGIAFASSVAALGSFDGVSAEIDRDALLHYFCSIRTSMGDRTLLEDVKTLEPGLAMMARRSTRNARIFRYWEFPIVPDAEKEAPPLDEAIETVRGMVTGAIHEQMVSDVPLGGFLSGGIDSTVIASVAAERGEYGAYNVGYGEHDCNEWPYVRMAAENYGINCREVQLDSSGFVDTWRFLMREKGLPLTTPNEVPIYHLAHALRQDYTVALSGEGADEVFGGYVMPYFSSFDYDRARRTCPLPGEKLGPVDHAVKRLYGQSHLSSHIEHHFLLNSWMTPALQSVLLKPEVGGCLLTLQNFYQDMFDRFEGCSTMDKLMHMHARVNLEGLLNRVDSSTMSASVETRVPFTDHRMAEYLYRLPNHYRMTWRDEDARQRGQTINVAEIDGQNLIESKVLLRRAFGASVPEDIMNRRKVSFPVPFREWLGGALREFAASMVEKSGLVQFAVQENSLQELINGADNPSYGMLLWPLVNLAMWEETCLGSFSEVNVGDDPVRFDVQDNNSCAVLAT